MASTPLTKGFHSNQCQPWKFTYFFAFTIGTINIGYIIPALTSILFWKSSLKTGVLLYWNFLQPTLNQYQTNALILYTFLETSILFWGFPGIFLMNHNFTKNPHHMAYKLSSNAIVFKFLFVSVGIFCDSFGCFLQILTNDLGNIFRG